MNEIQTSTEVPAPVSTAPSRGHLAERFHVDGQGQVHIGDRHYYYGSK